MHRSRVVGLFLSLMMLAVASFAPLTVASAHGMSKKDHCEKKCHQAHPLVKGSNQMTHTQMAAMMTNFRKAMGQRKDPTAIYDVTIQGNLDGIPFTKIGILILSAPAPLGSVNQFNICLSTVGFNTPSGGRVILGTNAGVGDISLSSQSACYPGNRVPVDLGRTSLSDNTATLQVDPTAAATDNNGIATGVGLFGFEPITSGGLSLQVTDDLQSVNGQIQVGAGPVLLPTVQPDIYTATFTGTLVSIQNI